jgi:hypothetical protein
MCKNRFVISRSAVRVRVRAHLTIKINELYDIAMQRKVVEKSGSLPEAGFGGDECVAAESHFQFH